MIRKSLNGTWQLTYRLEGPSGPGRGPEPRTIAAEVPGNVEIDLMKAGELPDLFFGENILKVRPYEFYEWTYENINY